MPKLSFAVEGAAPIPYAAAPLLAFQLRIDNAAPGEQIQSIALQCQVRIDARRRTYDAHAEERLLDLFGARERWGETVRSMLWTFTSAAVKPFTDSIVVELPVPCTFDFNVAAAKYFYALEDGEVPLSLLFSGTMFYATESGALQIAQVPWDREATYRLPVQVWKDMMAQYYPNSAWLSLRQDVFDRLYRYKIHNGLPSWEQVISSLLPPDEEAQR